jgi:bifunctional DNA-binding transcriptional regulator/antitoxin component of YhaV-PrlF toxin-antitoxin module
MVQLKVRLGPKGQIVIPKIFRESYKLYPNQEVIVKAEKENVSINSINEDPIHVLEEVSKEAARRRKGKKLVVDPHEIYEQYDKRAKRAGL